MYWSCWDGGGLGMLFGPVAMVASLVVAALLIISLFRAFGISPYRSELGRSALDILKERFARGEIDRAQHEEGKRLLATS